jgi:hypothetical protein
MCLVTLTIRVSFILRLPMRCAASLVDGERCARLQGRIRAWRRDQNRQAKFKATK